MTIPPPHAIAALLLTAWMFIAFARGRMRVEIISLVVIALIALGLYVAPLPGKPKGDALAFAFAGFGHPALVTICALMIMGRGLVVTGALEPAARALTAVWRVNQTLGLGVTILLAMVASMFVNDTPVLVLLLPIMVQLAARGGMPTSKTLMSVNAAVLIGGMSTTIGTSTNLLVVAIASDLGMRPLGIFDFTPIVLGAMAIAFPFLLFVMPRLLPDNSVAAAGGGRTFEMVARIGADSPLVDRTLAQFAATLPDGATLATPGDRVLKPGDRFAMAVRQDAVDDVIRLVGDAVIPAWQREAIRAESAASGEDVVIWEAAITPDSRLIGRTIGTTGMADTYRVAVIGCDYARDAMRVAPGARPFRDGDVLLVTGTAPAVRAMATGEGLALLDGVRELARSIKAPVAIAIMAGALGLATTGVLPIAIAALGGAIAMFATGCVKLDRVGRALSATVIVLIAASIAIGRLVLESGAADWMGSLLAIGLVYLPAAGVIAAIMLFVTILTNFASNATAAAVGTPIAFGLARQLGMPVEPLVLAVLFGCNLCYATPVAYQTNLMIMAEGGYQFRDYVRAGAPLVVLMIVSLSTLLAWRYGLLF